MVVFGAIAKSGTIIKESGGGKNRGDIAIYKAISWNKYGTIFYHSDAFLFFVGIF